VSIGWKLDSALKRYRCLANREQLERLPDSHGQNLALTGLFVPYSLDSGKRAPDWGGGRGGLRSMCPSVGGSIQLSRGTAAERRGNNLTGYKDFYLEKGSLSLSCSRSLSISLSRSLALNRSSVTQVARTRGAAPRNLYLLLATGLPPPSASSSVISLLRPVNRS